MRLKALFVLSTSLSLAILCSAESNVEEAKIRETVDSYVNAWRTSDSELRSRFIESVWSEDSEYKDPTIFVKGSADFEAMIVAFHESFPGAIMSQTSEVESYGTAFRFSWRIELPNGDLLVEGLDLGEMDDDGKLASITGFFGRLSNSQEQKNKELVVAYLDALFKRFDIETIGTLISEDAVYTQANGLPYGGTFTGIDEWKSMFVHASSYYNIEIVEEPSLAIGESGSPIIASFKVLFKSKAGDDSLEMTISEYFDIENGKIVGIQPHYFDTKSLVDFLGL